MQYKKIVAFGDWANLHVKPVKCEAVGLSWKLVDGNEV
jgi:hypothetical protein